MFFNTFLPATSSNFVISREKNLVGKLFSLCIAADIISKALCHISFTDLVPWDYRAFGPLKEDLDCIEDVIRRFSNDDKLTAIE